MNKYEKWLQDIEVTPEKILSKTIKRVAEEFDESLLLAEEATPEAIEFICRLFSTHKFLRSKGIERFLLDMNVDLYKYPESARNRFLEIMMTGAKEVSDQLGRHSIGDFIARAYPPEVALDKYFALSKGLQRERHIAFVMLDVLRRRANPSDELFEGIKQAWEAACRQEIS